MNRKEKKLLKIIRKKIGAGGKVREIDLAHAMGFKESDYGKGTMQPTGYSFDPNYVKIREVLKARGYITRSAEDFSPTDVPVYHFTICLTQQGYEKLDELKRNSIIRTVIIGFLIAVTSATALDLISC